MACNPKNPCAGFYGLCLDVKIIDACNGTCAFCIEAGGKKSKQASVSTLIHKTNSLPVENVLILGGEPLLYKDLVKFVKGVSKGKRVYITTNASLLDSEIANKLGPYVEALNLSIHHFDMEENERITGVKIDIPTLKDAIQTLHKHGAKVRLNCNLVKGAVDSPGEVMAFAFFAKSLGADGIRFAELQNAPDQYVAAKDVFPENCDIHTEPFSQGCEQRINLRHEELTSFDMKVRLTCGLVNPALPRPLDTTGRNQHTLVMYPDGTVDRGWRVENCHEEKRRSFLTKVQTDFDYAQVSCHGSRTDSCHGSSSGCH